MSKKKIKHAAHEAVEPVSPKTVLRFFPELLITALSLSFLIMFIGIITGIHYDETWVILRCRDIANGLRPLDGMTYYAGAIHDYILWPFFSLFGYTIEVLRIVSALFNAGAVALTMLLVHRYYPKENLHRFAGFILCTTPAFIIFSRYAIEVHCLNLFLTISSLLLIARAVAAKAPKPQTLHALIGGACLGVMSYNHIIGIAVPLSLLAAALLVNGRRILLSRTTRLAGIGFMAGFSVKIYEILFENFISKGMQKASESSFGDFLADLPNLPYVFHNLVNGSLLYQRFVGSQAIRVFPYLTLITILLVAGRFLYLKKEKFTQDERFLLSFFGMLIFFTIVISPNFTPHYFILPIYLTSLILVVLARPYLRSAVSWLRKMANGLLIALITFNIFYVGSNYFYSFLKTGGTPSVFMVGKRLIETSNSWVRFDKLYQELLDRGVKEVVADLSIYAPMQIHDFYNERLSFSGYDRIPDHEGMLGAKTALIFYNGINLVNKRQIKPPDQESINFGTITYMQDRSYDSHFKVFIADPLVR
jgi:4-amino-4-deoxy-L-arabinose transferase-like glycosyltransferase